jgi:hypothetical protein
MSIELLFVFAGFVVLLGLALGTYVNAYWYLLTAFAGLNMIQAQFTGFCPSRDGVQEAGPARRMRL